MKSFRLFTFIKDGFKGVFRNGLMSVASILVLLSSLLVIGIFATLVLNVNHNLSQIDDFNELVCYMNLEADEETLKNAEGQMKQLDNVLEVTFISKEDALASEKEKYGDEYSYLFDAYTDETNPLPDAYRIEYESVGKLDALIYKLGKIEGIDNIRNSREIAINIEKFKNIISVGCTWLMAVLAVVSVFVVSNTVKITYHSRELEITIMRYIGATKFYITMPFIVEGIILSLVSACIAFVTQWYIYRFIVEKIVSDYDFISIIPYANLNGMFLLLFFGASLIIGIFGTAITIRKYMRV